MGKLTKPKLRSLPKKPKASASLETWKKYEAKVKEVQKANNAKVKSYNEKKSEKDQKLAKIGKIRQLPKATIAFR